MQFAPAWRRRPMKYTQTTRASRDCGCGCGGSGACGVAALRAAEPSSDCGCGCGGSGACGQAERAAGRITPPGVPCPFGASRLPDGRCPGDDGVPESLGGALDVPPNYDALTPDQRAAWARAAVARQGGTPAEQEAAAQRARGSSDPMIAGIISQGAQTFRQWLSESSAERRAQIEAEARVRIAEIQARSGSAQAQLELERLRRERDQVVAQPASSGGGDVATIGVLALAAKLLGVF